MKYLLLRLKRFCGFSAGIVFFIAGIFKLLDPVGSGLVMKEYMDFLHISFMSGIAKPLAVALALLETVVGTALVTGIWRRLTAIIALGFQTFFTFLTLFLLIFNPEMDCGCFGEVVHLTHLETFLKNVILLLMLVAFAFPFRHIGGPKKHKYVSFGIVMASVIVFSVYTWLYNPLVDYTAFKPAAALQAGSAFGSAQEDIYEAVFIYEKDDVVQEFTIDNLPDSTWTFIDTKTVEKQELNTVSLSFYDSEGFYHDTLAVKGKVMVMSIYDVKSKQSVWRNAAQVVQRASDAGFQPLVLVSSYPEQMDSIYAGVPEYADILKDVLYYSDYKTLITMNRSNGGVTYFCDGYLVKKWSVRTYPDDEEMLEIFVGDETETIIGSSTAGSLAFQGFLLYVFAVMLLL